VEIWEDIIKILLKNKIIKDYKTVNLV